MSTLLSAQETSQADMVDKLMGAADADGDGALTSLYSSASLYLPGSALPGRRQSDSLGRGGDDRVIDFVRRA